MFSSTFNNELNKNINNNNITDNNEYIKSTLLLNCNKYITLKFNFTKYNAKH